VQEHRAGGRHCLYRPESGAGHQVTLNGRPDPPRLAPRAGSSSNEPCSIPFTELKGDGFVALPVGAGERTVHAPGAIVPRVEASPLHNVAAPRASCSSQPPAGQAGHRLERRAWWSRTRAGAGASPELHRRADHVPPSRSGGGCRGLALPALRLELDPCVPKPEVQPGHIGPVGCIGNTSASPRGVYVPTASLAPHQGLLRSGARVTARGSSPRPPRRELPEREGSRFPGPNGVTGGEKAGRQRPGMGPGPALFLAEPRDRCRARTPSYGGRTAWRAKTPWAGAGVPRWARVRAG
jgi:hypothetical protein